MHNEQFERLVSCFKKVFRDVSPSDIPTASHENIGAWDSVAQITLLSVVGQEFGIPIDFEDFEDATSFAAILDLVRARTVNVQP